MSSGAERMPEPDDIQIDYNSPLTRDTPVCIPSIENPEEVAICGGDPGSLGKPRLGRAR